MNTENNQLVSLPQNAISAVADTLKMLVNAGDIKVSDLFPGLSPKLTDPKFGGEPGRLFVGEVQVYNTDVKMPDDKDGEGDVVDILQVQDILGDFDNSVFNFNAGNGGLKAKVRGVKDSKYVLFMFKGWAPTGQTGIKSHYKDWLILGSNNRDTIVAAAKSLKDAVKLPAAKK